MDEVVEKLSGALITTEPTEEEKSNFVGLYKNWGKLGNQEERRREILEVQKSNRRTKLDQFRGIIDLVNAVEEKEIFHSSKRVYYRPSIYVAGFNRTSTNYNNVLMLSEWMIEKPADLAENWYLVPCPKGVRLLVVANQGRTKCYTKYGHFKFEKRTALPGGNPIDPKKKDSCCVLDCFYYEKTGTMFILDILAWNRQPMTDGETEFRHYWLQSQLAELPGLKVINKKNQMKFEILPKIPCDTQSLNNFFQAYPAFENNVPPLDGLLFYHKRAHYFAGETPLVGWLYPFMVPEVLGEDIEICKAYELTKPENYVNQADYIMKFEEKLNKRKSRSRRTSQMDTTEPENETETTREPVVENSTDRDKSTQGTMETEATEDGNTKSNSEKMDSEEKNPEKMDSEEKISDEMVSEEKNSEREDKNSEGMDSVDKNSEKMESEEKVLETTQTT